MQTRGIPSRSRRNTNDNKITVIGDGQTHSSISAKLSAAVSRRKRNAEQANGLIASDDSAANVNAERTKRDVPGCITNYNAQRQLLVGCTQPNVIEVRPQCNEDGDEGMTLSYKNTM